MSNKGSLLKPGDKVAIVAPSAGIVDDDAPYMKSYEMPLHSWKKQALAFLENDLSLKVSYPPQLVDSDIALEKEGSFYAGNYANSLEQRALHLADAISDPETKLIINLAG